MSDVFKQVVKDKKGKNKMSLVKIREKSLSNLNKKFIVVLNRR